VPWATTMRAPCAPASVRSTVEAMKLGAVDYIAKPFDHDERLPRMSRILRSTRLERQNEAFKTDIVRGFGPGNGVPIPAAGVQRRPRLPTRLPFSATLPHHHRDPFDRLLIAQAQLEKLPILTSDRQFAAYDVRIHWARCPTSAWPGRR